jgi:anthranilate synthase component 1
MRTPSPSPYTLRPIVRELSADLETPVSLYLKLSGPGPSFLLESVTGGEQVARYSFIGTDITRAYIVRGDTLEERALQDGEVIGRIVSGNEDPMTSLRPLLAAYRPEPVPGLPRFSGGLVGYLGYDAVRFFEPTVPLEPHPHLPDAVFLLADSVIAFDHAFGRLLLIVNAHLNEKDGVAKANERLDVLERRINAPLPTLESHHVNTPATELTSTMTREQYMDAVVQAKEHITAGDIFQVVVSQRLSRQTSAAPFDIYRALRRLNPSPYMFFFDFDGLAGDSNEPLRLIGASPEVHVRLEGRRATLRPIAGTRPRGKTPEEDAALEKELLADPKELAEHVMLVDLGRNDLGRVCDYGSVHVAEQAVVERYSHVMHIVSQAEGQLRPEFDAFDLMRATFPAGTVSGAPKVRAMQIIHDLEGAPRGVYAGAVGYFSYDGSMDTCIALRTMVMRGQTISVQAGAGLVADSDPATEYQETMNKARALLVAVERAERVA